MGNKRLIETVHFPLSLVNEVSASEKSGGGRPPFWEMVFWWTRKPLSSARAVIAASLLPAGVSVEEFTRNLRLVGVKKKPHNYNPHIPPSWNRYFSGKKLLDPFAGFGSIPLEAFRMGLDTTAVELLPTAYVFLKAVLEYPAKYGKDLVGDVERWGTWITERLQEDPEISELYDDDVAVYIGTWEVRCPHCDAWTPLIGNHWLARVKSGNSYKRLAFMRPRVSDGRVEIEVVDINRMAMEGKIKGLPKANISEYARVRGQTITLQGSDGVYAEFEVPESNIHARRSQVQCLVCGNTIRFWDERNGRHYNDAKDLEKTLIGVVPRDRMEEMPGGKENPVPEFLKTALSELGINVGDEAVLSRKRKGVWHIYDEGRIYLLQLKRAGLEVYSTSSVEWYVKWALKKYHEGDERFARQRLLVKVKVVDGDLIFEPCTEEDNAKLERAKERVRELIERGEPDVPTEPVAPWGSKGMGGDIKTITWGLTTWDKHFNPRQLLTLVKLVKLIREVGRKVEEEKIREGWSEEDAFAYAEAVATYLSVGLCKHLQYNALPTGWNPGFWGILKIRDVMGFRGIAMQWNWIEVNTINRDIPLSYDGVFTSYLLNGMKYLTSTLSSQTQQRITEIESRTKEIKALLDDATTLSKLNDEKYDVIVTDPPYADDVPYTELSDFYYVWLKRALSDSDGRKLLPRFHKEAFFKPFGRAWREIKTQWQEFARKEVSTNPGRFMDAENRNEIADEHFRTLLTQAFAAMAEHLKDDGIIATYYAHTSPEAWAALLDAGWQGAKMRVTNAFPIVTESAQRVTSRGKLALDTAIVVTWRRGVKGSVDIRDIAPDLVRASAERTLALLRMGQDRKHREYYGFKGRDIMVGAMAATLSVLTRYEEVYDLRGKLSTQEILTEHVYPLTTRGMIAGLLEELKVPEVRNRYAAFYLVVKAFFGATSNGERFERFKPSRTDISILSISLGMDYRTLMESNLLKKVKGGNEYVLLEPTSTEPSKLEEFLRIERRVDPSDPEIRNPVDLLHLMEYLAATLPVSEFAREVERFREQYPAFVDEAIALASIFSRILREYDPERKLSEELLAKYRGERLEV